MKKLIYRLTNGRTPETWELPLRNIMLPKVINETTGQVADKFIHYLPGAPSIWAEDYKGDKKPFENVIFENGVLEVEESNVLLIEILNKHRFKNVHYELFDNDVEAENKLAVYEKREQASVLVSEVDDLKIKALALVLIGGETQSWSALRCKAELKERAYNTPELIIDEANKPNYEVKYLVGLAYLQGIIQDNESQTSVLWSDTKKEILRIAVGETGLNKMTEFLFAKTEASVLTLQRIGELSRKVSGDKIDNVSNETNVAAIDVKSAEIISAKDQEIAELKAALAQKNKADLPETEVIVDQTTEEVLNGADLTATIAEETVRTLEDLQKEYATKFGRSVPNNKKTDANWLLSQLQ